MIRSSKNVFNTNNDAAPPFYVPDLKKIKNGSTLVYDKEKRAFVVNDVKNVDPLEIVGFDYFIANGTDTEFPISWYTDSPEKVLVFINGVKIPWSNYGIAQQNQGTVVVLNTPPNNNDLVEIYGIDQIPFSVAGVTNALVANVRGENLGAGAELFAEKIVANSIHTLKFKSLLGGNNVDITDDGNQLTIDINESDIVSSIPSATETSEGIIRIATQPEVDAGVEDSIAVTPKTLKERLDDYVVDAQKLGGYESKDFARQILSTGSSLSHSIVSKASAAPDASLGLYGVRSGNGIIIVNVDEDLVISNKNGGEYIKVVDDYTITHDKFIIGVADTSSPRTLTLPNVAQVGRARVLNVKDESDNANANNITIVPHDPSQTIDGQTSYAITQNRQSVTFYCDGNRWHIIDVMTSSVPVPGGPENAVQINRNSGFFGSIDFTYDEVEKLLTVKGGLTLSHDSNQVIGTPAIGDSTQFMHKENVIIGGNNYIKTQLIVKTSDDVEHIISTTLTPD